MGRERQKKKNRSSVPKTKPTLRGRTKYGKKKVNFLGNAVIAENWYADPPSMHWNVLELNLASG
jgi:Ribosome biogenesis protein Nop16